MPYFGATPDGIVECDCCGRGCVEVKCPFTFKDIMPCHIMDKHYCLNHHFGKECDNQLKFDHRYFVQVQAQMAVCDLSYCDFVVYTTVGVHIERIFFDLNYFNSMKLKITTFFCSKILPELLTHSRKAQNCIAKKKVK